MSHFTEVKTQIKNKEHLKTALKNLGHQIVEAEQGVDVRGYFGDTLKGEFKILTKSNYDIGFKTNEDGNYEFLGDWELMPKVSGIEKEEFASQVKREYAKVAIYEMAKSKGMEVEVSEENGNIEMVVSQW